MLPDNVYKQKREQTTIRVAVEGLNPINKITCEKQCNGSFFFSMCRYCRIKVSKGAKIRNRYNQVPHLTKDTNGKVTNSQLDTTNESKRSALSQQVTTKHI